MTDTKQGHEQCTYTPHLLWPENQPTATFIDKECLHGFSAGGAFYTAEYVHGLERALLALVDNAQGFDHSVAGAAAYACLVGGPPVATLAKKLIFAEIYGRAALRRDERGHLPNFNAAGVEELPCILCQVETGG